MEKDLVLGIDYGGKYTGLAVVDRQNNTVLYAKTIKMRDDIVDILKRRREQRGIRRTLQTKKKRLRELKNYLKSIGFDESAGTFKTIYKLAHKRGYDYADMPEEKTSEEIKAMDAEERKQYKEEQAEWEKTKRNSRHRKEVLRDVREVMRNATEEQIRRVEGIFNKQYRPKRYSNRILTKCKVEDCGKNTPLGENVRDLLIENIVRFFPVKENEKDALKEAVLDRSRREEVKAFFRRHRINEHLRKQVYDIADNKLSGRTVFCKKHILEHTEHTKKERKVFRLAPSLKVKIANVLDVIKKEIWPDFNFNRVVMEANNFDIETKTKGGGRKQQEDGDRRNGKDIFLRETGNKCIYCGKQITSATAEVDHIYPKKAGGINVFANLVASCKTCNEKKKGRTPLEAGLVPESEIIEHIKKNLKPKILIRYVGKGKQRKKRTIALYNDLKLKILEDATNMNTLNLNSIRYMSYASIGWRHMRDELRGLAGNDKLPIERQSGIYTAHFRKWWGFTKERGNHRHHALDAVILASRKSCSEDGRVDMTLKPCFMDGKEFDPEKHVPELKTFTRRKDNKGGALHDANPLSFKSGLITHRKVVTEVERGQENTVVSEDYRKKLTGAFERFGISKGKCLTDEQAKEAGFYLDKNDGREREKFISLKCMVRGIGPGQLIKIKNNVFKTNIHNVGVAVCLDRKGKKKAFELKNPRLSKHFIELQQKIDGKVLFTLKRGDVVAVEGEEMFYRIKKLGISPLIEAIAGDRKTRTVAAVKLTKAAGKSI